MNSKLAIEEYRRLIQHARALASATHTSGILSSEFIEASRETKVGDTVTTYHKITTPLMDIEHHLKAIFEKHIGRLVVSEVSTEVWDARNKRKKRKA